MLAANMDYALVSSIRAEPMNFRHSFSGIILALALCGSSGSEAQSLRMFCLSAKATMARDAKLNAAARSAFPTAGFSTRDSDCLYPVEALHYADADVLITMVGKPGDACHGCGADLSAYVLARSKGRSAVLTRFDKFASSGTFGNPGQINALNLTGHDAFVIKASGTFQGHRSTTLSFFVFNAGQLIELEPFLPLSADNTAGVEDEKEAVSVDGAWTVDPARPDVITVTYKVKSHGRERPESVSWAVQGATLKIARGRVPPEYDVASGN